MAENIINTNPSYDKVMAAEIIVNIIVIAAVVLLIVSLRLSKKPKHLVLGAILAAYGSIKILGHYEAIPFNIPSLPIITYILSVVVTIGGASLILDSFRERTFLKWASLVIGITVIMLSITPTLHEINAITFEIPSYPEFINFYLYFFAGILLLVAAFIVTDNPSGFKFGKFIK